MFSVQTKVPEESSEGSVLITWVDWRLESACLQVLQLVAGPHLAPQHDAGNRDSKPHSLPLETNQQSSSLREQECQQMTTVYVKGTFYLT